MSGQGQGLLTSSTVLFPLGQASELPALGWALWRRQGEPVPPLSLEGSFGSLWRNILTCEPDSVVSFVERQGLAWAFGGQKVLWLDPGISAGDRQRHRGTRALFTRNGEGNRNSREWQFNSGETESMQKQNLRLWLGTPNLPGGFYMLWPCGPCHLPSALPPWQTLIFFLTHRTR